MVLALVLVGENYAKMCPIVWSISVTPQNNNLKVPYKNIFLISSLIVLLKRCNPAPSKPL
jgi:hypothetical protein